MRLCPETTRLRKPWHKLSGEEQMLYVDGFQRLRREGTLATFMEAHNRAAFNNETVSIHESSQAFYWHSYWVWEMESEIRNFGGEYSCFSMPYWDITHDGEYWKSTTDPKVQDLPIYNSNLGGEGDFFNDYCVSDAPWNLDYYDCDSLCSDDEISGHCCLKRLHTEGTGDLFGRSDFGQLTFNESLANFTKYSQKISSWHGQIHEFIGSVANTHFHPTGGAGLVHDGEPAEDPLFALFHAFIDYIQMMRADCNQYDLINSDDLDEYEPWAYDEYGGCTLDYLMDFSVLCEDGTDRYCTYNSVTPRVMFDISPNGDFDVVYELGDFWHENEELQNMCADTLNDTWWNDEDNLASEASVSVSSHMFGGLRTFMHGTNVQVIVLFVVALSLSVLKWYCESRGKNVQGGKMKDRDGVYGAI